MAASQLRPRATASVCSLEKESGEYSYQIALPGTGYISSARFTIGGHDFRIRYYPDGTGNGEDFKDYVGVELELMSEFSRVTLAYEIRLVDDQAANVKSTTTVLTAENSTCRTDKFNKKKDVRRCIWNDSLKIHCKITVIKEAQLREAAVSSNPVVLVQVPPPNLSSHLGELLSPGRNDGDITFKVKSEVFRAHKLILDIRCPALKTTATQSQLDGQTIRDRRTSPDNISTVVIEDMEAKDFKALLHFIYTDSFPQEHRNDEEMAAKLLAAADKYDLNRMKLYCGNILSRRPTVDTVTTTIAVAHKHHCPELKDACIRFIHSSEKTRDDVLSSQGYKNLKATCPEVTVDIMEETDILKKAVQRQQDPEERRSAANYHAEGRRRQGDATRPPNPYYYNNVATTDDYSSGEE